MKKYKKSHTKKINLKYHLQHGVKNLMEFTWSEHLK